MSAKKINQKIILTQKNFDYSKFYLPLLLILTAIVFANTIGNGFISNWDDGDVILNNDMIKQLNWSSFKEIIFNFRATNFPLTIFTFALENKFFGLNPVYFHLTNFILHLLNVILVYVFIKRLSGKPLIAFITALLFGIHPMHVESVAWITERKDLLYSFFFLLSLNSYSKYLIFEKKNSYLIWSFIWFFLSLMSKPAAVCLPLVLVLMDYYIKKDISIRSLITKIPLFLLSFAFGIIAYYAQKSVGVINNSAVYSITDRIFMFTYSAIYYLIKVIAPFNLSAIHYYPNNLLRIFPIEYYLSLPALILIIWAVYKIKIFKHKIIFGLLFYLITILMVLQIIPYGQAVVCERYSYIPYIGLFFIVGTFFSYVFDKNNSVKESIKIIFKYAIIIFSIGFCYLTYERNKVWKNDISLFTDVVKKSPEEGFGWWARGNSKFDNKEYLAALNDFDKSSSLGYKSARLFINRGLSKCNLGNYNDALPDFNLAVNLENKNAEAYFYRGNYFNETGKYTNAIDDFNIAIKLKPAYSDAFIYRGASLRCLGKMEESLNDFNEAVKLDHNKPEAYYFRGTLFTMTGKYENAVNDLSIAVKLKPDYFEAYCNRGAAFACLKKMNESLNDFNSAIEINPKFAEAYYSRGFTKLNLNDKEGACKDWVTAQQLGFANAINPLNKYCK